MSSEARERSSPLKQVGRYTIFQQVAAGGMATVHLARFSGPAGFSRVVAVKHLHAHLAADPDFREMFIEEARLVSRIRHANVVPTLDVVVEDENIFLAMEYIAGESLSNLRRAARQQQQDIPLAVCSAIVVGALQGLHAAHEARSEMGHLLGIVHRDVSPANIMVGIDGVSMMLDFGVAKAMQAHGQTDPGLVKGKSSYMAPEQVRGEPLTRAADIFAAAIVLWELLTTRRLFGGATEEERMYRVLQGASLTPPSMVAARIPAGLDDVVMKGLRPNPDERYRTAQEMAEAIEHKIPPASQRVVGEWVARTAAESLSHRAELMKSIEISEISVPPIVPNHSLGQSPGQSASRPPAIPLPSMRPRPLNANTGGINIGTGLMHAAQDSLSPRTVEKLHVPLWRDRRAIVGGGGAALLLAGILTVTHQSSSGTTDGPTARPIIGETVIIKPETQPSPKIPTQSPTRNPSAAPMKIAAPDAPEPGAPPTEGPAPPAAAAIEPARAAAPTTPPAHEGSADRRAQTVSAKSAHDRAPNRRAPTNAHPTRARLSTTPAATATASATPPLAEPAAPARPTEEARARPVPTSDLKKRVPLVDDHPRVEILE